MKRLIILAAVASLIISPAFAQTSAPQPPDYNLNATENMLVTQMKNTRDWQATAMLQSGRADKAEADLKKARDELAKAQQACSPPAAGDTPPKP